MSLAAESRLDARTSRRALHAQARRGFDPIERRYETVLAAPLRALGEVLIERLTAAARKRLDEAEAVEGADEMIRVVDRVQQVGRLEQRKQLELSLEVSGALDDWTTRTQRELLRVYGVDLPPQIRSTNVHVAWARTNAGLITRVHADTFEAVKKLVVHAFEQGKTTDWLAEAVRLRMGIGERRARLIARDQLGKLNGQITEQRQTDAGITHYVWSTSRDERVRPEHAEREGQVFAWDDPPEDGHPGQPIQCRCVALPSLTE